MRHLRWWSVLLCAAAGFGGIALIEHGPIGRLILVVALVAVLAALIACCLRVVTTSDHAAVEVGAEPQQVFTVLVDPEDVRLADPRMSGLRLVTGVAGRTGALYEYALQIGRKRVAVTCEIVAAEPPRELGTVSRLPTMVVTDKYQIRASATGSLVELLRVIRMTPLVAWATRSSRGRLASELDRLASLFPEATSLG